MERSIAAVETFLLRAPLATPFGQSHRWYRERATLLVRLTTTGGHQGWGEGFGTPEALAALVHDSFAPLVLGTDPLAPAVLWQRLFDSVRARGWQGATIAAISAIDIACWDLAGRILGVPVSTLLGGRFRERVPAYASALFYRDVPDLPAAHAAEAAAFVARGYRAVKMKIGRDPALDRERVLAVRGAIGPRTRLMLDANQALDPDGALRFMRQVEAAEVFWLEEPLPSHDRRGAARLAAALEVPVAGGECEFTRYGFRDLIASGAVDIVQVNPASAGGLGEARGILALAQAAGLPCLPHNWAGAVAFAAALHFTAATPEASAALAPPIPVMLEHDRTENPLREELLRQPLRAEDGCIAVPDGPGLGVDVDEEALARYCRVWRRSP